MCGGGGEDEEKDNYVSKMNLLSVQFCLSQSLCLQQSEFYLSDR